MLHPLPFTTFGEIAALGLKATAAKWTGVAAVLSALGSVFGVL
jgi:hypothetical protein